MIELCGRTKNGGGKCQAVALQGKSFCKDHDPRRQRRHRPVRVRYFLELPLLEDRQAICAAINQTIVDLASYEIGPKLGGKLLYALQLALSKKKGTPPVMQSSPHRFEIAEMPGHDGIYCTTRGVDFLNPPPPPPAFRSRHYPQGGLSRPK
jgi:hypothetical protein